MVLRAKYSPDEARDLLEKELSKSQYQDAAAPWWQQLKWWLEELFYSSSDGSVDWIKIVSAIVVVVVVLALGTYLVRAKWSRRITASEVVESQTSVTQLSDEQVQAKFDQAIATGDYHRQVVWGFRCLTRIIADSSGRRTIAGLTAFEVAEKAGQLGYAEPSAAVQSADTFTRALYGHKAVTAADAHQVAQVLRSAQQVRATTAAAPTATGGDRS